VRFGERLREAGLRDHVFDAVVAHIEAQGLLVKEGAMVDATIIEQSHGRRRADGSSTRDEEASFTKKRGRRRRAAWSPPEQRAGVMRQMCAAGDERRSAL